jgi:uracil-DNA glycosylase
VDPNSLLDEILAAPSAPREILLGHGQGKPDAPIMIVGEAWGEEEERTLTPFVGRSGEELSAMLRDAGLMRSECFVTNVVNARPPRNDLSAWIPEVGTNGKQPVKSLTSDMVEIRGKYVKPIVKAGYEALLKEIELVKPRLIIAVGNTSLWALCGRSGITRWRGSLLDYRGIRVVPTYHPAAVLRMREWRPIAVHDLCRAARELERRTPEPDWTFQLRPTFAQACWRLNWLYNRAVGDETCLVLEFDIETVKGHIRCFALSWSMTEAICIPLMTHENWNGYWSPEEEGHLLWLTYRLLTHRNCGVRGQNLLYDFQYTHRHWHYIPNLYQDTMLTHHVLWAGMPKALLFQASMYCEYFANWKDMVRHNEEKEGA